MPGPTTTMTPEQARSLVCQTVADRCETSATARELLRDLFPLLAATVPGFRPYRGADEARPAVTPGL